MTRTLLAALAATVLIGGATVTHGGWDPTKKDRMIQNAETTIAAFKKADPGMQAFFDRAYGYSVYPSIGKGAIGIGGATGTGVVYQGGEPIGSSRLTQVTIGFQLGGQAYSEIVFFEDRAAMERFKAEKLEFSAQASAVAATAGASADAAYEDGVAVFTMAKGGLMYEASIGGQNFSFEAF